MDAFAKTVHQTTEIAKNAEKITELFLSAVRACSAEEFFQTAAIASHQAMRYSAGPGWLFPERRYRETA
jgi:hypothetical protein